jgi:hypothetical protein
VIGPVVRLQVQRSPLKPGVAPRRWYDPSPILAVEALHVDRLGVHGVVGSGAEVLDVHHPDHPLSRNRRRRNGISVMTTADYVEMRRRFGAALPDGIAGETVLVDATTRAAELCGETVGFGGAGDGVRIVDVAAAPPCVEFARFCLGRSDTAVDPDVLAALTWLEDGRRGVYAVPATEGTLRLGDIAQTGAAAAGSRGTAGRQGTAGGAA